MKMSERVLLTKQGYEKLQTELKHLEKVVQPQNIERVTRARAFCDFNEDSEYEAALREQATIKQRIQQLKYTLRQAHIIQKNKGPEVITLGTEVEIIDLETEEKEMFTIVRKEEADPSLGKVSAASPLGEALLGATVGESCRVQTPNGSWHVKVITIK